MSLADTQEEVGDPRARAVAAADSCPMPTADSSMRYWFALFVALAAVRGVWFMLDPTPMLFLGDSASYILTALTGWIPPDRSFLYGYIVRVFGVWPGSLTGLLAFQAACSVVAGLLLAAAIVETIGRRPALAALLAVAWTGLEPLSLLWERYVMAEACALPLFGAFVFCGLRYIRTRRVNWLLLTNLAGAVVVALRLPFVSVAWIGAVALPLLALIGKASSRRVILQLLLSVAFTGALHTGYMALYGSVSGGPAGYQHAEGAFLLAAWAPLIVPEDFPDPRLGRRVLQSSTCQLRDRRSREGQRWSKECLVLQLEKEVGDPIAANTIARSTAFRLAKRDPLGVARLALDTWLDFFDYAYVRLAMRWDRRDTDYGEGVNRILAENFGLDGSRLPQLSTPTSRLYYSCEPWLLLLAGSPILAWLALLVNGASHRWANVREGLWIAAIASASMGMMALTAMHPAPRFLHPLGWLALIWIAELLSVFRAPAHADHPARADHRLGFHGNR